MAPNRKLREGTNRTLSLQLSQLTQNSKFLDVLLPLSAYWKRVRRGFQLSSSLLPCLLSAPGVVHPTGQAVSSLCSGTCSACRCGTTKLLPETAPDLKVRGSWWTGAEAGKVSALGGPLEWRQCSYGDCDMIPERLNCATGLRTRRSSFLEL